MILTRLGHSHTEECELKLRDFIYKELGIHHFIEFGNLHRFGKRGVNEAMPIVARFIYRRDIELVLKNGYRLRNTPYGAKEQFPVEIENRRRSVYPIMKQARRENKQVTLVRDKLFIEGELYTGNQEETIHTPVRQQPLQDYRDHLVTTSNNTRPYRRKATTPVERNEIKNYRP